MSDVVIRADDLSKAYRLYKKPSYRFLDLLGLLPPGSPKCSEHPALSGINLEIRRGEKVAIIGRNGAGKSTLLKLITRAISPSRGTIAVDGRVHALMQIGTGFHPDLTGRDNVAFYLSHLGVAGPKATASIDEIIEFAELEEYIDQPLKTYSTGMAVRLMFAASTVIVPDILIIDEVLGVGDAYFAHKSFERLSELASGRGTTVLLVSHDIYSASKICSRVIWIDQGHIVMDGEAGAVVSRYEASIRDQEERRLRLKRLSALRKNLDQQERGVSQDTESDEQRERTRALREDVGLSSGVGSESPIYFGQLRCSGNVPLDAEMPIRRVTLFDQGTKVAEILPGEQTDGDGINLVLQKGEGSWGEAQTVDSIPSRSFCQWGSIFHRAPFVVVSPRLGHPKSAVVHAEIEFKDTASNPCVIELIHSDGGHRLRAEIGNRGSGEWVSRRVQLEATTQIEAFRPKFNRYGTQEMSIVDVEFLDGDGRETHLFRVGGAMKVRLHYVINDPQFQEKPTVQINFLKDSVIRSHRFTLETATFDYKDGRDGYVEVVADPLLLGPGKYLVNLAVMRQGGYRSDAAKRFFTLNAELLDQHNRAYEVEVLPTGNLLVDDVVSLHPAQWFKDGKVVSRGNYPIDSETRRSE